MHAAGRTPERRWRQRPDWSRVDCASRREGELVTQRGGSFSRRSGTARRLAWRVFKTMSTIPTGSGASTWASATAGDGRGVSSSTAGSDNRLKRVNPNGLKRRPDGRVSGRTALNQTTSAVSRITPSFSAGDAPAYHLMMHPWTTHHAEVFKLPSNDQLPAQQVAAAGPVGVSIWRELIAELPRQHRQSRQTENIKENPNGGGVGFS